LENAVIGGIAKSLVRVTKWILVNELRGGTYVYE
jgi:hypothetical protein